MRSRVIEFIVGIFILCGLFALLFLAFRVSDFGRVTNGAYYLITAQFDNIGGLKVRAPVAVAGVKVGEVAKITLDQDTFRAVVSMKISSEYNKLPVDTAANIFTQGILGSNYISLSPGFEQANLVQGNQIETTHSALILESLIGQLIYNLKSEGDKTKDGERTAKPVKPAVTP